MSTQGARPEADGIPQHHLDRPRPAPIRFEPCQGHIVRRMSRPDHTLGKCFSCADWSQGRGGEDRAVIFTEADGTPSCRNYRPLVSAEQAAAVDETFGHVVHGATARKGYASTDEAVENSASETVWCSPHCATEANVTIDMFGEAQA